MSEILYHFTSKYHLPLILKNGYLNVTESNLKEITKAELQIIKRGEIPRFNTDIKKFYKPVVWLTNSLISNNIGLGGTMNKSEIKFTLKGQDHYEKWSTWSQKNNIKTHWFETMKRGYNWDSWYICESVIPLTSDTVIKIENTISGEILIDIEAGISTYKCTVERARGIMPIPVYDEFIGRSGLKKGDIVEIAL